ncbi:Ig-like domain-containing protein [Bacillus sp. AFS055030]|uniref:Ig-like domain-containing protein n=1 Tax=Bacillus sp. AFS055030 TaxID=2033507 RepID=UPI000BFDF445|nr:Ig-like domain-containing protein [Bacillus sp. AFS055030]PGL72875.1 hypothetical protein CN925_02790 [Bacillus sp. AFS055030]
MRLQSLNRVFTLTIIFTLFISLFSNLTFAASKTEIKVPKSKKIVKMLPSESTVSFALSEVSHKLSIVAVYEDGTKKDVSKEGQWTSANKKIVTVKNGTLKAISTGSTQVQFKLGAAVSKVDVSITIKKDKPKTQKKPKIVTLMLSAYRTTFIKQGEKKSIQLKALYSDGSVKDVTSSATWKSSDTSIVKVSKGEIKGITAGDTFLKVKYSTFPEINFFVSVKEVYVETTGLELSVGQLRLEATDKPVQVEAQTRTSLGVVKDVKTLGKWEATNTNVATVNSSGLITPVGVGEAYIYFKYDKFVDAVRVKVVKPKKLVTDTPNIEILPNASFEATLNEVFNDGTSVDVRDKAAWTSDNPSIATVTNNGLIIGGKTGKTKIRASYRSNLHPPIEINVNITNKLSAPKPIGLTATPSNFYLKAGEEKKISIKAIYSDGMVKDVTNSVELISSDPRVASGSLDKVTGHNKGTAILTAIFERQTVDIPVIVKQYNATPLPEKITVTPNVTNMIVNEQKQLNVKAYYSDGSELDVTSLSLYNSSNPNVVSIDKDGLITAHGKGTANVSVYSMDYTKRFEIVVSDKKIVSRIIDLEPSETDIKFKITERTHPFSVKAKYQDGSNADVTSLGRCTTLNPDIVTVENGVLTAVSPGTTQVLINNGTITEILDVTILPESPQQEKQETDLKIESLLVNTFDVVVQRGKLYPFKISGQYNDGVQRNLTQLVKWKVKNPSIASISEGKIIGKKNGKTTIIGKIDGYQFEIPVNVIETLGPVNLFSLTLSQGYLLMQPGDQPVDIIPFAEYTNSEVVEVDREGKWESTDESVAKVDQNGVITPVGTGEAHVFFRYHNGFNDAVWVRVMKPKELVSNVGDDKVVLEPKEMTNISIDAVYGNGRWDRFEVTDNVEWSVADETVATISDTGRITAQSVGKTTITASYLGVTKELNIEVVAKHATHVVGIFATPDNVVKSVGSKMKLKINALFSDGTVKDITTEVFWRMSNSDVAYVTKDHYVFAASEGAAVVRAEYAGFSYIIPIVVIK